MSKHCHLDSFFLGLLAFAFAGCGAATERESATEREPASETTPLAATVRLSAELIASEDARTQAASGDVNFGGGIILWTNVVASHQSFVKFALDELPVDAVIESAEFRVHFNGNYAGENVTELGRVEGSWEEATLTWNNQPDVTWGGPTAPVGDAPGDLVFNVTDLVAAWQRGDRPNNGVALRSTTNGGKQYNSRESANFPPRLVISYSVPEEPAGPHPDLGDAPDSTNHFGLNNTAYAATGVLGRFPTVFQVPAGQAAGPRHDNQSVQGLLGQVMSREDEADLGPDQDGPNNILRNALAGVITDVADRDRGDDGWRNRWIRFFNCEQRTLEVRVSRPALASTPVMYLNVWFDGDRDGAWDDRSPCFDPESGVQASHEWIVQNRLIDMTTIPAGGFRDFNIDTLRVMNQTEGLPHWMRFTLSDTPATVPAGHLPDGRGPHPLASPRGYRFGETEDLLQNPPPPMSPSELGLLTR